MNESCRLCGGAGDGLRLRATDTNRRLSDEAFDYVSCTACDTVYIGRIPDDLGRFYPPAYYALPTTIAELASLAQWERFKLDIVRRAVPGGRLLEIGPGTGAFALLAKEAGYDVETLEMDAGVCRFLEEVVGVRAINEADPVAALGALGPYDAIAMWHVFEHVPSPGALLAAAAERLTEGGALVIAAPNPGSLQFRLFGARWTHLDAPRHLQLVPIDALTRAASRVGLRAESVTCSDPGGIGWNRFGWRHSLGNLSARPAVRARLERLGDGIARAVGPIERRGTRGSTYTVTFRKE
jgi:2-polyprenyl-3-methyl-5-hydroxy-6-metoxy-1,4-benzoquinol methylase